MIYSNINPIIVSVVVLVGALLIHKYVYFERIDPYINKVRNILFKPSFYYNSKDSNIKSKNQREA